jgi:predicted PurR-regulated permease PerM
LPAIVFLALLGTLLTNSDRALRAFKDISPLDDDIDQLFLDRIRIMTKAMMLSIVVVAVVQGLVTGLLMALGGTPHVIPLTIAAMILAILPGGAAIIAVPVGIAHLLEGNIRAGLVIIIGSLTLVSAVANQVRPWMVSKDAYLNRAVMLLSVFSGLALFGMLGVVYGPLIMVLFTTMLEVYLQCFRPKTPSVTLGDVNVESLGQLESDEPID